MPRTRALAWRRTAQQAERGARRGLALGIVLVLVVAAAYAPVVRAGFIWDDDEYVTDNANLQDFAGLQRIWLEPDRSPQYYPLVFTSFWLERHVFGPGPLAPHLVNVTLHLLNAWLIWWALARLRVPGAAAAALLFAVHPVHLESVAWITERKNVLSAAFYLLAAHVYLSWARLEGPPEERTGWRPLRGYLLVVGLFLCALLSKTVTATLPAALLLVTWWRRGRLDRRDWVALFPLLVAGVAFGGLTAWLEVHHVGAAGTEWTMGTVQRLLVAGRAVWFYAGKLVWPHPLMFVYPRWAIDTHHLGPYLYPAGAVAVVAALWLLRPRLGRGPLVAVLFFGGSLVPALGFFSVYPMRYSYVADHFQYLASIGLIALAAAAGAGALGALRLGRAGLAVAAVAVVALMVVTRAEAAKFSSLETLWTDTVRKNPGAWLAQNNLGYLRLHEGRLEEAETRFRAVLRLKPDLAQGWNNLGNVRFRRGDVDEALRCHRRAIEIDPGYAEGYNNLGVDLAAAGRQQEAIDSYRRALRIDPAYAMAHYNLANALIRTKAVREAETQYREALRLRPDFAIARYYLGVELLSQGRRQEAQPLLDEAFRGMPEFALGYYQVGTIQLQQHDLEAAVASYSRAIALKPDYAEAYCNQGTALLQLGRLDQAIERYREALRLKPDYAVARNNLALALRQQRQAAGVK